MLRLVGCNQIAEESDGEWIRATHIDAVEYWLIPSKNSLKMAANRLPTATFSSWLKFQSLCRPPLRLKAVIGKLGLTHSSLPQPLPPSVILPDSKAIGSAEVNALNRPHFLPVRQSFFFCVWLFFSRKRRERRSGGVVVVFVSGALVSHGWEITRKETMSPAHWEMRTHVRNPLMTTVMALNGWLEISLRVRRCQIAWLTACELFKVYRCIKLNAQLRQSRVRHEGCHIFVCLFVAFVISRLSLGFVPRVVFRFWLVC